MDTLFHVVFKDIRKLYICLEVCFVGYSGGLSCRHRVLTESDM